MIGDEIRDEKIKGEEDLSSKAREFFGIYSRLELSY